MYATTWRILFSSLLLSPTGSSSRALRSSQEDQRAQEIRGRSDTAEEAEIRRKAGLAALEEAEAQREAEAENTVACDRSNVSICFSDMSWVGGEVGTGPTGGGAGARGIRGARADSGEAG